MASNYVISQLDEKVMSCGVCFEKYTSVSNVIDEMKNSKMLACFHSFCKSCLVGMAKQCGGRSINCPVCRKATSLDSGRGVDALINNYTIENLIDVMSQKSMPMSDKASAVVSDGDCPLMCGYCDEDNKACWGCMDCGNSSESFGLLLCEDCRGMHGRVKAFKSHSVVILDEFLGYITKLRRGKPPRCQQHPHKDIEFHCDTCNLIVCALCVTVDHVGHHFELLQHRADKKRIKTLSICNEIKSHLEYVASNSALLHERISEFESEKSILHYKIDSCIDELISLFRRRRKAAHAEVEDVANRLVSKLQAQHTAFNHSVMTVYKLVKDAETAIENASHAEVYQTFDQIDANLLSVLQQQKLALAEVQGAAVRELTVQVREFY